MFLGGQGDAEAGIDDIARPPVFVQVLIVAAVTTLSMAMMAPGIIGWALGIVVVLLCLSMAVKQIQVVHMALFAAIWLAMTGYVPWCRQWPLKLLGPLVVYGAVAGAVPSLRRSLGWLHPGRLDRTVIALMAVTTVGASIALVLWTVLVRPDLQRHLSSMPRLPLWLYPLFALGFAALNAAIEEIAFRGIIMDALDKTVGRGVWPLLIQAASFAVLHYGAGFPNGVFGVAMVFVYGVMLGLIRGRSGGLLAPWLTHVAADITIFVILAVLLARG